MSEQTRRLLLVEDDAPVRHTAARVLRRSGYRVVEAKDGVEALAILERSTSEFDLVLSDVMMPNLGGWGLYTAMQERDIGTPVLFVSGYPAEELAAKELLDPSFDVVFKPWAMPELLSAVRRALDPPTPVASSRA